MITKITNGKIVTKKGIKKLNIYIKDEKITAITNKDIKYDSEIDATGCFVFPGLIDAHTHLDLQQGEFHTSDNFENGTKIALSQGITTVIDYLPYKEEKIPSEKQFVNYNFHKVITEKVDLQYLKNYVSKGIISFKIFTTYSNNGWMLNDGQIVDLMENIKKLDGVLEVHCENDGIILNNIKKYSPEIKNLPQIREPLAELEAVNKIAFFAMDIGVKLHFVHITMAESVDIIELYNRKNKNMTLETCPQYLFCDNSLLSGKDAPLFTTCPPLRDQKNVDNMLKKFRKGAFNMLTTDHCSFTKETKMENTNTNKMAYGLPSLGYSFRLMLNLFEEKRFNRIISLMGTEPAQIFGIPKRGELKKGNYADIVLVREKMPSPIEPSPFDTSGYNPYSSMVNKWKIEKTLINGRLTYDNASLIAKNGRFTGSDK
jgi:dihydropyrimidinase